MLLAASACVWMMDSQNKASLENKPQDIDIDYVTFDPVWAYCEQYAVDR